MFATKQSFTNIMSCLNEQEKELPKKIVQSTVEPIEKGAQEVNHSELEESSKFFENFYSKTPKANSWEEFSVEDAQTQVKKALKEAGV